MTDDELEQALFALPFEEPPADLHARILAVTVHRPRLTFQAWEIWTVGTLIAFVVWLAFLVATSVHDPGGALATGISHGIDRVLGTLSINALVWAGLGVSFAVWVSQLTLPPSRRGVADR